MFRDVSKRGMKTMNDPMDQETWEYITMIDDKLVDELIREMQTPMGMVEEFRETAGQKRDPDMAASLIVEEYHELIGEDSGRCSAELKELADLVYVCFGYANSKNWDLDEALRRVHENNMGRMYQDDGTIKYNDDGKVIKNPLYPKVDLGDLV